MTKIIIKVLAEFVPFVMLSLMLWWREYWDVKALVVNVGIVLWYSMFLREVMK